MDHGFRLAIQRNNQTKNDMPRIADPNRKLRGKLNLTIHPEIRDFAEQLAFKRRRSVSQLFEDLVEAEWFRYQAAQQGVPAQPVAPQYPQPAYYGMPKM
jgi:hypothetical protein